MNPTDQARLQSASLKIKRAESWTLSDAEREAYGFYYGPRALDEVLTIKAPTPPKPPRVQGVSRREVREALEVMVEMTAKALRVRDTKIAALEAQLVEQRDQLLDLRATQAAREPVP